MPIKIRHWICNLRLAKPSDIYELCAFVQQPGTKVEVLHDLNDVGDHGVAVVIFSGEGTNEEIKKAFLEAYEEKSRIRLEEWEQETDKLPS